MVPKLHCDPGADCKETVDSVDVIVHFRQVSVLCCCFQYWHREITTINQRLQWDHPKFLLELRKRMTMLEAVKGSKMYLRFFLQSLM